MVLDEKFKKPYEREKIIKRQNFDIKTFDLFYLIEESSEE